MNFGSGSFTSYERYNPERIKACTSQKFKLHLGLPQWGEKSWRGSFYPQECKDNMLLDFYSKVLGCVEVSSTFYAPVSKERMTSWASQVPDQFRFVPKWPEVITHQRGLIDCVALTSDFLYSLEGLGEKCGTTMLQLPPSFSKSFHRELYYFLLALPQSLNLAIEFRHPSWFERGELYPKLFEYLQKTNRGMVLCDTPGAPDVFHQSFPGKRNIVRYLSDQNRNHDKQRLGYWRDQLTQYSPGEECYFFVHQEFNETTPELLSYLAPEWKNLHDQFFLNPQQNLF